MLARLRPHLTYANVMATVAVFVALGGAAFAATSFIGSDGQVHGCVDKKGHLTLVKAGNKCGKGKTAITWNQQGPRGGQGLQGIQGVPGAPGSNGATKVVVRRPAAGTHAASCHPGERATGGGIRATDATNVPVSSIPTKGGFDPTDGDTPDGWYGAVSSGGFETFVVCASP